jgi:hypothetical protein
MHRDIRVPPSSLPPYPLLLLFLSFAQQSPLSLQLQSGQRFENEMRTSERSVLLKCAQRVKGVCTDEGDTLIYRRGRMVGAFVVNMKGGWLVRLRGAVPVRKGKKERMEKRKGKKEGKRRRGGCPYGQTTSGLSSLARVPIHPSCCCPAPPPSRMQACHRPSSFLPVGKISEKNWWIYSSFKKKNCVTKNNRRSKPRPRLNRQAAYKRDVGLQMDVGGFIQERVRLFILLDGGRGVREEAKEKDSEH